MTKLRVFVRASGYIDVEIPELETAEALMDRFERGELEGLEDVPFVDWDDVVNALDYDVEDVDIHLPYVGKHEAANE